MCQNGWTDDEPRKMTISCVPVADNPYETTPGLKIGYSSIPAGSKQHNVSVDMRGNMADASVAGLLEGMLILTFQSLFNWLSRIMKVLTDITVVAARKGIVGTLRGTTTQLCTYNTTNRDCVPTGQYTITAGSYIDFTFTTAPYQELDFYYAIMTPIKSK
jgi:hypothetical protein